MTVRARHDAIVIGAGIVGAACAAALARDGWRVLVLDGEFPGGGTTAAGMGHLVVMDDSPEQLALTRYSLELWNALAGELPADVELDRCGTLWVAEDPEQLDVVRSKQALYDGAGVHAEVLDERQVAAAEPHLRSGLAGGLLVPGDAVLYPPAAARFLLEVARLDGATVRGGCTVDAIVSHGVRCGAETLHADVVVNAAGAVAARLTPQLPIVPRKGHLVITDRYPGLCRRQIVELGYLASAHQMTSESVAFNVQPRPTGQILIGSSRELTGWDASLNPRMLRQMLTRAIHFMPALSNVTAIRAWNGFRPATPDKLPLVGVWPATAGLWIAAGHEGLGITTSLATGQLLADQIAGRPSAIDATPYMPLRLTTLAAT